MKVWLKTERATSISIRSGAREAEQPPRRPRRDRPRIAADGVDLAARGNRGQHRLDHPPRSRREAVEIHRGKRLVEAAPLAFEGGRRSMPRMNGPALTSSILTALTGAIPKSRSRSSSSPAWAWRTAITHLRKRNGLPYQRASRIPIRAARSGSDPSADQHADQRRPSPASRSPCRSPRRPSPIHPSGFDELSRRRGCWLIPCDESSCSAQLMDLG